MLPGMHYILLYYFVSSNRNFDFIKGVNIEKIVKCIIIHYSASQYQSSTKRVSNISSF